MTSAPDPDALPQPASPRPDAAASAFPAAPAASPSSASPSSLPAPGAALPAPPAGTPPSASAAWTLAIRFTGSGSEYFRIWIVNLLLIIVTLGIYYPWARIRKLRYFASNTWIGNDALGHHALEFLGRPGRMLLSYIVMSVAFVVWLLVSSLSTVTEALALLFLFAIIPVLTWGSLRFRLGNTRWRGLRFAFAGSLLDAYAAWQPMVMVALISTVLNVALAFFADGSTSSQLFQTWMPMAFALVTGLAWVWCLFRVIKYRQDHLRFGNLQTRLDLQARAYLWLLVKAGLLTVLLFFIVSPIVAGLLWLAGSLTSLALSTGDPGSPMPSWLGILILPVLLLMTLGWQILIRAWLVAREQNLVWSNTKGEDFAFHSRLSAGAYIRRNLANWFLILITLGLYQPFAAIRLARMRLDALSITTSRDPAAVVARAEQLPGVAGDAGADVFGVDIGL